MRIAFLYGYPLGPDVLWRTLIPARYVSNGFWMRAEEARPDMADAFFLTAPLNESHVQLIQRVRRAGKPIIVDICEDPR